MMTKSESRKLEEIGRWRSVASRGLEFRKIKDPVQLITEALKATCELTQVKSAWMEWRNSLREIEMFQFPPATAARPMSRARKESLGLVAIPVVDSEGELRGQIKFESDSPLEPLNFEMLKVLVDYFAAALCEISESPFVAAKWDSVRLENEKYRAFVANTSMGVWRCETAKALPVDLPIETQIDNFYANIYFADCNLAMAQMYGYEGPDQVIGKRLAEVLDAQDPVNGQFLKSFVDANYNLNGAESVGLGRQGDKRYFLNNLVGIIQDGALQYAWGTKLDITEDKHRMEALDLAARQSASDNQAKSYFLASMSHEIRTPLGIIVGFADLALDSRELSEETRSFVATIRRNGQQLTKILGEVLDLSKIEAKRMEIEALRFPLQPFLSEVLSSFELTARMRGLTLKVEAEGFLPFTIRTDPTKLRQILTNLIGNALKFTAQGGVTLKV